MSKRGYTEPTNYIPEEIRRKLKLGEFYEEPNKEKPTKKKTTSKAEAKPKTRGTDSKGKWVMIDGKKCYSDAEVMEQLKKMIDD